MKRSGSPEFPRGGPKFWETNALRWVGDVMSESTNMSLLDELTWRKFYEGRMPVNWERFLPQIIQEQSNAIVDGIEKFQLHRWKNAIPKEGTYFERERVTKDLKVLHEIKTLNLAYTRQIQYMVNKTGLEEKIALRHLLCRLMTGVGTHEKDAYPPENMKEYTRGQKSKTNKGTMFRSIYLVMDYWVDTREEEILHPIQALGHQLSDESVYFDEANQIEFMGEEWFLNVKGPVYDSIGIIGGFPTRLPRLYNRDITQERASAFLNYLLYKGVGKMKPKHTALYFADEKVEPFFRVLPPIQTHRHALDRWARHYHQIIFAQTQHTCSPTGPYPFLDNGKQKMSCELSTFKRRLVAAAGHNPSRILFEHMAHCGNVGAQGMLPSENKWEEEWEEETQRLEFCFHRNAHNCARCCATDPVQEFFVARTTDHPFLARYHPIHLNL